MPRPLRALLLAIGCAAMLSACSASTPSPTPAPSPDSQEGDAAQQRTSPDQGADDAAAPSSNDCVEACVTRNQMRATAIEQLRQDCATECDQGTPKPGL